MNLFSERLSQRSRLIGLGSIALVVVLFFQNCMQVGVFTWDAALNNAASSEFFEDPQAIEAGKVTYEQNCAACHGTFAENTKPDRSVESIRNAIRMVPQMVHLSILSETDLQNLAAALKVQKNPAGSSTGPGLLAFTCEPGADPTPTDLRRLSRNEYLRTLADLSSGYVDLNLYQNEIDSLPADTVSYVFDNADRAVTAAHIAGYMALASRVGGALATNTAWLTANLNCNYSSGLSDACWNNFFNNFAMRVFRRSLSTEEQTAYRALYTAESGGSLAAGFTAVNMALLQSPHFLYKVELSGALVAGRADISNLSSFELASRLAFLATGRGPDLTLLREAAAGSLGINASYRQIVNRLFTSNAAREHVQDFYRQWLGVNRMPASTHSDWFLNGVPRASIQPEAQQEIDDMVTDLTWTSNGSYTDLMTSNKNFVRGPALAAIYGVTGGSGSSGTPVTYEAESMTASTGQADTGGWNLYSNGTLTRTISLTVGQTYQVQLRARASLSENIGAQFSLRFGTQVIATGIISATNYTDFNYQFVPGTNQGTLTIEFLNDAYDPTTGADRNLYVDRVVFTPQVAVMAQGNLPAGERPGVISRVGFLLSGTNQASLVHRGLIVRRNLLCDQIANPVFSETEKELFTAPDPSPTDSLRTMIETRTNSPRCLACHTKINPMGFVLENYDSLGRFRTVESVFDMNGNIIASHAINAMVTPNIQTTNDTPVNGLAQMSAAIANSTKGPACMSQQWFSYVAGRSATQSDGCSLNSVYQSLTLAEKMSESGDRPATLMNMMKSMAFEPNFKIRKRGAK